jgi:hypothetical protein
VGTAAFDPHETLYSVRGGPAAESTIAASPDGRYVAATYNADAPEDDPNEYYSHTIVVDLHGQLLSRVHGAQSVPMGNTGWLNGSQLTCALFAPDGEPERDLTAIDVLSGERRPLRSSRSRPMATLGDRFLFEPGVRTGEGPRLDSVTLQGDDWLPFVHIREPSLIMGVDAATTSRYSKEVGARIGGEMLDPPRRRRRPARPAARAALTP